MLPRLTAPNDRHFTLDILHKIAERRLEEAFAAGELDDFAGKGEPLLLEDLSAVPEELRAGYILLKSGGFLPKNSSCARR